jgi:Predicted phosphatases
MIGDREHDIIGAKMNGIDSVGVLYGYGSREEFEREKANFIVNSVSELRELLSK